MSINYNSTQTPSNTEVGAVLTYYNSSLMRDVFVDHERKKASNIAQLKELGVLVVQSEEDLRDLPKEQKANLEAYVKNLEAYLKNNRVNAPEEETYPSKVVSRYWSQCYINGNWRGSAWHLVSLYDQSYDIFLKARAEGKPVLVTVGRIKIPESSTVREE